jgi:hypothetical protein
LAEIVRWKFVEFAYERSVRPPLETITDAWHEILIDIVGAGKREGAVESQRQSA